jgi:hypothetical protein
MLGVVFSTFDTSDLEGIFACFKETYEYTLLLVLLAEDI